MLDYPLSYVMLYNLLISLKVFQISLFQSLGSNVLSICYVFIHSSEDTQEGCGFAFIDTIICSIFLSGLVDICRSGDCKTQFLYISYLNYITHQISAFYSTSVSRKCPEKVQLEN